jgi:hypothetical protein
LKIAQTQDARVNDNDVEVRAIEAEGRTGFAIKADSADPTAIRDAVTEIQAISEISIPPDIVELVEEVGQLQDDAEATTKQIKALQHT